MFGVLKSIDWYWAIVISTPTIAGCLYIYKNVYKRENESLLLIDLKEICWDRLDGRDLLWCNISNSSSKNISGIEIVLIHDGRDYIYPQLDLNQGQRKRIDLLSIYYKHSYHSDIKYTDKVIYIEGENPYFKQYGFEFDNEYRFNVNVTAKNTPSSSITFALTIKPGSSTQMDYGIKIRKV